MASSTAVIPASAVAIDTSAVIGSGAVGVVYKARYANETVVVKRLKLTALSDSSKSEFLQEAKTLASLNHPRIVRFLGVILDDSQYSIVLEYLPLGSLYSFYTSSPKLPYALRLSLASDVAAGMTFLHRCDPPVLHRDMKSLNILMYVDASGELHCKITDFGIAIVRQSAVTTTSALSDASEGSQAKGTLVWMAPELHNLRAVYRFACDVYSFGIVLSELFSWLGPFGIPTSELRSEVLLHMLTVQKQVPEVELDEDCPASLLTLVESCVSLDPSLRPSFDAINRTLNTLSEGLTIPFASEVGVGVKPLLATMVATTNFDVTETAMHTNSGSGSLSPSSSFDRFNSSTSSERFNLNQPSPTTSGPRNISAPYTPVPVPMSIPAASIPAANIPAANYTPQSVYDMANASYIPYEASYTPAASYTPPAAPYVPAASSYTSPYIQPYPQPYPHSTPANNNRSSIPAYSAYPSTTPSTSSVSPAVYEFSPPKTKKSMSGSTKAVIIVITVLILAGAGVGLYIALRPKPVDAASASSNGATAGTSTTSDMSTIKPTTTLRTVVGSSTSQMSASLTTALTSAPSTSPPTVPLPSSSPSPPPTGPPPTTGPPPSEGGRQLRSGNGRCLMEATAGECTDSSRQWTVISRTWVGEESQHLQYIPTGLCIAFERGSPTMKPCFERLNEPLYYKDGLLSWFLGMGGVPVNCLSDSMTFTQCSTSAPGQVWTLV